jgi:homeobox protein YOX1/YHP1
MSTLPPGYDAAYGIPSAYPAYSYGVPDPNAEYYYGMSPAYEPRNSSSAVPFTSETFSSAGLPAPPASRSVTSAARSGARSHAHPTHYAPYTPYSRLRPPVASASTATHSSGAGDEYPAVKKKRKRADAHQLKILNEVSSASLIL